MEYWNFHIVWNMSDWLKICGSFKYPILHKIIMHKQYLHDKSFLLVWLIIEFHFTQNSFKANQFLGHCCLSDWNSMGLKWMVISLVCEMMKELWISSHLCPKPICWGECTEWEKDANTSMHSKLKKSHFMQNSF